MHSHIFHRIYLPPPHWQKNPLKTVTAQTIPALITQKLCEQSRKWVNGGRTGGRASGKSIAPLLQTLSAQVALIAVLQCRVLVHIQKVWGHLVEALLSPQNLTDPRQSGLSPKVPMLPRYAGRHAGTNKPEPKVRTGNNLKVAQSLPTKELDRYSVINLELANWCDYGKSKWSLKPVWPVQPVSMQYRQAKDDRVIDQNYLPVWTRTLGNFGGSSAQGSMAAISGVRVHVRGHLRARHQAEVKAAARLVSFIVKPGNTSRSKDDVTTQAS